MEPQRIEGGISRFETPPAEAGSPVVFTSTSRVAGVSMKQDVVSKRVRFLAIASLAIGAAGLPLVVGAQDQPGASQNRSSGTSERSSSGSGSSSAERSQSSSSERSASERSGAASGQSSDRAGANTPDQREASRAIAKVVAAAMNPEGEVRDLAA